MSASRKILTMGGGGFLMEPNNPLLDHFFFSLAEKGTPKVCFVPTASGDCQDVLDRFYSNMKGHDVKPSHLSLFKGSKGSLSDFVMAQDLLYVGGGNTRNLLVLWKEWGLDKIIRRAYENGTVLGGVSAGSICWFEHGVTDSIPGELNALDCLGFLKESNCPHYDGEKDRRPAYHRLILQGMPGGIACDDGVAAFFENEKLVEFVSSRREAKAYKVTAVGGKISEERIEPRFLGLARLANPELARAIQLRKENHPEQALRILQALLQDNPNDPDVNYHAACACDNLGREAQAVSFYEAALAGGLTEGKQLALLGLGSTYRCLGEYEKSIAVLDRAVAEFPNDRALKVFRALSLYNLGRNREAVSALLTQLIETSADASIHGFYAALNFYSDKLDEKWS